MEDSWTKADPEPGDFDTYLEGRNSRYVAAHPGGASATLRIVVGIKGEDDMRALVRRREQRLPTSSPRWCSA
jgi:hypothetical protein